MNEFRGHICWDANVSRTIRSDVGAIPLEEDAVFLATHLGLTVETKNQSGMTEAGLLRNLRSAIDENLDANYVVAVCGPSGSGKTHLIRWIRSQLNLDDERIKVVYIPRRVTTLRQITHLLLDQLGGDVARELEVELDNAVDGVSEEELAFKIFQSLWRRLKFNKVSDKIENADVVLPWNNKTSENGGLVKLLDESRIRVALLGENGTLRRIARSVLVEKPSGDSEKPIFSSADIDLIKENSSIAGIDEDALRVSRLLSRENIRNSVIEILNGQRDFAVRDALGFRQGRGLHEVFTEARKGLAGRQLVLMFEDLALMDFVDAAVLDEFANHGDSKHAPLRVIFAITDDKYSKLEETIRGRVTEEVKVGELDLSGLVPGQSDTYREHFMALYLNAARVGVEKLIQVREESSEIPNGCEPCGHKVVCHESFGYVELPIGQVGLYPYNRKAIEHGFNRVRDDRHRENRVLTPRPVIEELISNFLTKASIDLRESQMPGPEIVEILNDRSSNRLPGDIAPEFPDESQAQKRWFGVRDRWFDGRGVPEVFGTAFDLPESGHQAPVPGVSETEGTTVIPNREAPHEVLEITNWASSDQTMDARVSDLVRKCLKNQLDDRLHLELSLVSKSSPLTKELLKLVVGDGSFQIDGGSGRAANSQLIFPIPRSTDSSRVLFASLWLRDHSNWDFESPSRKWDMPLTQRLDELPIEFEGFMDAAVEQTKSRILDSINQGDLIAAAVLLDEFSRIIRGESSSMTMESWIPVARAADELLESSVARDLLLSFSCSRQGETGSPVAVDFLDRLGDLDSVLRTDYRDYAETFVVAATKVSRLVEAFAESRPHVFDEIQKSVSIFQDQYGETGVEDVDRIEDTVTRANESGVIPADIDVRQLRVLISYVREASIGLDEVQVMSSIQIDDITATGLVSIAEIGSRLSVTASAGIEIANALSRITETLRGRLAEVSTLDLSAARTDISDALDTLSSFDSLRTPTRNMGKE